MNAHCFQGGNFEIVMADRVTASMLAADNLGLQFAKAEGILGNLGKVTVGTDVDKGPSGVGF